MMPGSFDEELMTDWSLWVLDHGLPDFPEVVRVGESVPVAHWVGPAFASVLHVAWRWGDPDDEDYLVSDVEVFRKSAAGWERSMGGGGTGWFDPPLRRPELEPREAWVVHEHCSGDEGWQCCAVFGVAGVDAVQVRIEDADGVVTRPLDSPIGAFVACADGDHPALVRVLTIGGESLISERFGSAE